MKWIGMERETLSLYERELADSLMYRELLCVYANYGYIFCH